MTTKKKPVKRKPKPPNILKIPCLAINKFIEVKRLTESQLNSVIKKLKDFVKSSPQNILDINNYVKIIIDNLLTDKERDRTNEFLDMINPKDIQVALASIYNAIVDYYFDLRMEYICGDVNGVLPDSIADEPIGAEEDELSEKDFENLLGREAKPKKSSKVVKPKDYVLTLPEIVKIREYLLANIIGQDKAIESVVNSLKLKSVGFTKISTMFFLGRTGVGKSQIAKLLGSKYSGNFFQVNCSDFVNNHEINKLTGSPPGYIGSAEPSQLSRMSAKSNRWVFLFDEIEKGNEKFFNWLLPLIETGITSDNAGNVVDFSDSIFVFTSNCGVKDLKTTSINFNKLSITKESTQVDLMASVKKEFTPEFINRIDEFVIFNSLSKDECRKISELNLRKYPVKITNELLDYITENGFSDEYGARELLRFIKTSIALPLAEAILQEVPPTFENKYEILVENKGISVLGLKPALEITA